METLSSPETGQKLVTPKKEKRLLKHTRLLESESVSSMWLRLRSNVPQEVEASRQPYSKSHIKRLKRKAKEELAGGALSDIQSAIAAVESEEKTIDGDTLVEPSKNNPSKPPVKTPNTGMIGEGKGTPLSQTQRKKALYVPTSTGRTVLTMR